MILIPFKCLSVKWTLFPKIVVLSLCIYPHVTENLYMILEQNTDFER